MKLPRLRRKSLLRPFEETTKDEEEEKSSIDAILEAAGNVFGGFGR